MIRWTVRVLNYIRTIPLWAEARRNGSDPTAPVLYATCMSKNKIKCGLLVNVSSRKACTLEKDRHHPVLFLKYPSCAEQPFDSTFAAKSEKRPDAPKPQFKLRLSHNSRSSITLAIDSFGNHGVL